MPDKTRLIRNNLILLCLLVLFFGIFRLTEIMTNILILLGGALIITYLLLGPVHFVDHSLKRYLPRLFGDARAAGRRHLVSIIIVFLIFFMAISFTALQFLPTLSRQIRDFAVEFPDYLTRVEAQVQQYSISAPQDNIVARLLQRVADRQIGNTPFADAGALLAEIEEDDPGAVLGRLGGIIRQTGTDVASYLLNIGARALTGLIYALTCLILVFYLLMDGRKLKDGFIQLLPVNFQKGSEAFLTHFHQVFYHFVKGQVLLSILGGLYLYSIYSLFGLKFAFLLSFIFGLASILPVMGPWFGLMPGILVILFSQSPLHLVYLFFFIGLYYIVKVYWLSPKLVKPALIIHPVIFILTFLVCLKSASLLAILMSFPMAALICVMVLFLKEDDLALIEEDSETHRRRPDTA